MVSTIQWNPNVLVNSKELPTQNPPLALRGILTFKDRRLLTFSNSKLPTYYRCICVFL